jgi:hypothetical protein
MGEVILDKKKCWSCHNWLGQPLFSVDNRSHDGFQTRCKKCQSEYRADIRRTDPRKSLLKDARYRAKKKGIECTLTLDDIHIPEYCPILGFKLTPGTEGGMATSPSLDRIDAREGYVPNNVWVISHRANTIKGNAKAHELEAVLAWTRIWEQTYADDLRETEAQVDTLEDRSRN